MNFVSMTDMLPTAGIGWAGVFVVILVIVAAVYLLSMIGNKKK